MIFHLSIAAFTQILDYVALIEIIPLPIDLIMMWCSHTLQYCLNCEKMLIVRLTSRFWSFQIWFACWFSKFIKVTGEKLSLLDQAQFFDKRATWCRATSLSNAENWSN